MVLRNRLPALTLAGLLFATPMLATACRDGGEPHQQQESPGGGGGSVGGGLGGFGLPFRGTPILSASASHARGNAALTGGH